MEPSAGAAAPSPGTLPRNGRLYTVKAEVTLDTKLAWQHAFDEDRIKRGLSLEAFVLSLLEARTWERSGLVRGSLDVMRSRANPPTPRASEK
jgi:hypothetical protein